MKTEITHPLIGRCKYDESLGWYEGEMSLPKEKVALYLSAESEAETECVLASAASREQSLELVLASAKSYAAEELIELKNGEWNEADGSIVSHDDFVKLLCSESVTFYPDRSMEIVFKEGAYSLGMLFGVL